MRKPDTLYDRAAQLRALAIKAREDGKPLLAEEITRLVAPIKPTRWIEANGKARASSRPNCRSGR